MLARKPVSHSSSRLRWALLLITLTVCACSNDSKLEHVEERRVIPDTNLVEQVRGTLKDGKKHGSWYLYWDGQRRRMETWKNGVQDGVELEWSVVDGLLLGDNYYVKGKLHGRNRIFGGDDNRLTKLSWWRRGAPHGTWCFWSDNGQLIKVEQYHHGRHQFTEEPPRRSCPYTSTREGQHHFDPDDRTYTRPYPRTGSIGRRSIPLPGR